MPPVVKADLIKQLALQGMPVHLLACQEDEIFKDAIAGMSVLCTAHVKGEAEPASGLLKYFPGGPGALEQLTGTLTRWQHYVPGEPGSEGPFAGHDVPFGYVWINRGFNDVWVFWKSVSRTMDAQCWGRTLTGTDTAGDQWTFDLLPFRLY